MANTFEQSIQVALAAVAKRDRLSNVFFVGCGGSFAQTHVAKYAMDRESRSLSCETYNSAEFIARNMPRLGPSSLVVLCSTSGDTPETVDAATFTRQHGAYTIGLTTKPESRLAKAVDSTIGYENEPSQGSPYTVAANLLRIVFGFLRDREGNRKHDALAKSLAALPDLVARAQAAQADDMFRWAAATKREPVVYTMGSGPNYGVTYSFATCILQEMQWIHSQAIHAGEYFHGPFEITDDSVPFIILVGLGDCRKMDQRALDFAKKFTDKILVIDAEQLDLAGIHPEVLDYLQPLVFLPLLRMYATRLSEERGHPLSMRRNMWALEY
ncbi:MAG: SIS domain-containing protein [Gammaproteobacteria bacterium]|jgi:fructoselysine 6-phosphate deglycase|nr:SIS domain-containing protein [Gammaproteobacteria bacterium]